MDTEDGGLAAVIDRLRSAGVAEIEFDAKMRLRRLVFAVGAAAVAPPVDESVRAPEKAEPLRRTALATIMNDTALPEVLDA